MHKHEMLARVYKLKTALYDETTTFDCSSEERKEGAHNALNQVLDILQEFRE